MNSTSAIRRTLRRVPGAPVTVRAVRAAWERVRPFPRPRYDRVAPRLDGSREGDEAWDPDGLIQSSMSADAAAFAASVVGRLTPCAEYRAATSFYGAQQSVVEGTRRLPDLLTMLWAASREIRPTAYLEMGVWRGRSAAVVAALEPDCAIYGFDLWADHPGRTPSGGAQLVRDELRAVGHEGHVDIVSGDSRRTLPSYLDQHPDLFFDLMTFDGGKAVDVLGSDMANALPRLKVGGFAITDDLLVVPTLRRVWRTLIKDDPRFASFEAASGPDAIAVAIRLA